MSSLSPSATVIHSHFRTLTCPPSCLTQVAESGLEPRPKAWMAWSSPKGLPGAPSCRLQEEGNQGLKGRGIRDEVKSRDLPCSWVWPHNLLRAAWEPSWNHPLQPFRCRLDALSLHCGRALWVDLPTFEEEAAWEPSVWEAQPSPRRRGRFLTGTSSALGLDARFYGYDQYWWLLQRLAWSMAPGCDNSGG